MKKSELKDGAIIELRNGNTYILKNNKLYPLNYETALNLDYFNDNLIYEPTYIDFTDKLQRVKSPNSDIVKVDNSNHLSINWTWERLQGKSILTDEEKSYLKTVIEPVKDKVSFIQKTTYCLSKRQYIYIDLDEDYIALYSFKTNTQFKGMKLDKTYTLEELGLE